MDANDIMMAADDEKNNLYYPSQLGLWHHGVLSNRLKQLVGISEKGWAVHVGLLCPVVFHKVLCWVLGCLLLLRPYASAALGTLYQQVYQLILSLIIYTPMISKYILPLNLVSIDCSTSVSWFELNQTKAKVLVITPEKAFRQNLGVLLSDYVQCNLRNWGVVLNQFLFLENHVRSTRPIMFLPVQERC